jgi:hypothetical protein
MSNHHLTIASTAHALLVQLDNSTAVALTHAHSQMLNAMTPYLTELYKKITDVQHRGDAVDAALGLTAYSRELLGVKHYIEIDAQHFATSAHSIIARAQHQAIDLGLSMTHAHLSHIAIAPIRLPSPVTLAQHADVTQSQTPRAQLFAQLAPEVTRVAMNALARGISSGQDASVIAITVGSALKTILHRAIAIATTAIAAAYRGAVDTLVGNNTSAKILGWYWWADLQGNTCVACIFMHGSKHPLSEDLGSHPRCHCQKVFYTADTPPMQTGVQWLAQQSVEVQKATFDSDALYALYKSGTPLSAFVGHESDPVWGSSIYVRSIRQITGGK